MHLRARSRGVALRIAATCLAAAVAAPRSIAQSACTTACAPGTAPRRSWLEAVSGSEIEQYLRALQLDTLQSRRYPQTVRGFGVPELARMLRPDGGGPWGAALTPPPASAASRAQLTVLRPGVTAVVNSSFPFGLNDGPLWAGRGVSAALDAGVVFTLGPLSARLQPTLLWSQNAAFALFDESRTGDARFRDPIYPNTIDLPQRYGDAAYHRLDLGDSEVRLDLWGVAAGLSNARQAWGPGVTHSLVLGPNAPGFVHGFIGTSRPLPVGIGRLHARLVAGRLEESPWSPAPDSLSRRLGAGIAVSFLPGSGRSMELGVTRFFHRRWTPGSASLRSFSIPLGGYLLKERVLDVDDPESQGFLPDNQLASVFVRWAPPAARVELYGEIARNDAALDAREFITEPDHQTAYLLGFRTLVGSDPRRLRLLRAEWVNARVTHLDRVRRQGAYYAHVPLVQGHTNRGALLGSPAVQGGAGAVLGWDSYDPRGVSTVELHRLVRLAPEGEGAPNASSVDVQYAAAYRRTRFVRGHDLTAGATLVWELDRDLRRDAFNLNVTVGTRFGARGATPAR
jgi:hypothetical protein